MLRFYAVNSFVQTEYSPESVVGSDRKKNKGENEKTSLITVACFPQKAHRAHPAPPGVQYYKR